MFELIYLMFFSSMSSIIIRFYNLISLMISLEFMMISILMNYYLMMINNFNFIIIYMYLVFMVGEGCLGLSLLVSYIRSHNLDFFFYKNILKL